MQWKRELRSSRVTLLKSVLTTVYSPFDWRTNVVRIFVSAGDAAAIPSPQAGYHPVPLQPHPHPNSLSSSCSSGSPFLYQVMLGDGKLFSLVH